MTDVCVIHEYGISLPAFLLSMTVYYHIICMAELKSAMTQCFDRLRVMTQDLQTHCHDSQSIQQWISAMVATRALTEAQAVVLDDLSTLCARIVGFDLSLKLS